MEEPIFTDTITEKLYTEKAILLATFFGAPLAGGYLIGQNFRALNEPEKIKSTWLFSILILSGVLATALVPALNNLPSLVYSFIVCFTAHTLAKKYQGKQIEIH